MSDNKEIFTSETDFRSRYQYTQSDLLGEGGFAQVYKAYDKQFNEYVALKFYNKGEQGRYDVLHEMKDSRKFSHKNILRVHDAYVVRFEHTGGYSLVQVGILEYANGGNLRDFINTKPSETRFIEVLIGILSGLEYLHADKKIIHRDLSPENILMCIEGDIWIPKIADFGISKKLDFITDISDSKKSTQLLGKVSYMAPEQFYPEKYGIGGGINTNVDLWAFGIILYELFLQKKPFGNDAQDSPIKIIQSITNDPIPGIDDIPDPYRTVINRCLVKNATKRAHGAEELIDILKKPSSHSGNYIADTVPITEYNKRKKKPILVFSGILVFLAVIIGCYFIFNKHAITYDTTQKVQETIFNPAQNASVNTTTPKNQGTSQNTSLDSATNISGNTSSNPVQVAAPTAVLKQSPANVASMTFSNKVSDNIDSLYFNASQLSSTAEELLINGNCAEAKNKYYEALGSYKAILTYKHTDWKASTEIKKINSILDTICKPIIPPETPVKFTVRRNPANNNIVLKNISITDKGTIITLEIKPTASSVIVYGPGSEGAFIIEYKNRSEQLKLKAVNGIQTGSLIETLTEPITFRLVFDRLPNSVDEFNLLEGENRADDTQSHWNFIGIELIR